MNPDFDLLLKLKELEKETGYKIEQDSKNPDLFYISEPNATMPFATLDYAKEKENANTTNTRTNSQTSTLRECSALFLERVRGIIGKRIARSKEREDRSRAEIAGDNRLRTRDRQLCAVYGSQIWNQVSTREERDSAEQLRKKVEAQKESLKQFQPYKQQALKSYQQNGVTLTPNIKNLQNEITSSLNKDQDNLNNQEIQNNSSNLFSNFKNKLDNIHQNLANLADITFIQDTIKIDESKPQDNQKSQDSYLKTQHQIKRRRK